MSETNLMILLEELKTVQIVCLSVSPTSGGVCNAILELSMDRLQKVDADGGKIACPICGAILQTAEVEGLGGMARSIEKMMKRKDRLGIRFVIPQTSGK